MYWLITYSQKGASGNVLSANAVVMNTTPADWLLKEAIKYPADSTVLLFAIEITEKQFNELYAEI